MLPLYPQHQAIQAAADAEKADRIVFYQKLPFFGDGGGNGEGDRPDVSQEFKGCKILFLGDADGLKDIFLMGFVLLCYNTSAEPVVTIKMATWVYD